MGYLFTVDTKSEDCYVMVCNKQTRAKLVVRVNQRGVLSNVFQIGDIAIDQQEVVTMLPVLMKERVDLDIELGESRADCNRFNLSAPTMGLVEREVQVFYTVGDLHVGADGLTRIGSD